MIAEPSKGYAEFEDRIGSLLEAGSGFHPELTGRENVYLVFGRPLSTLGTQLFDMIDDASYSHLSEIVCSIPNLPLLPGVYNVKLWSAIGGQESDDVENAGYFIVKGVDSPARDLLANHRSSKSHQDCFILVSHSWQILPKSYNSQ